MAGFRDPDNADNDYYAVEYFDGELPESGDTVASDGEPSESQEVVNEENHNPHSETHDQVVDVVHDAVVITETVVLDEALNLPGRISTGPGISILVDVATETPADETLTNYWGALGGAGTAMLIPGAPGFVGGLIVGEGVKRGGKHFYENFLAPNCTKGARCPIKRWESTIEQ